MYVVTPHLNPSYLNAYEEHGNLKLTLTEKKDKKKINCIVYRLLSNSIWIRNDCIRH